jgi:predicted nucleotidyltransferase
MSENPPTVHNWQMAADCLAASENVLAAWHFGSTAQGRFRPGADVDIGVLFVRHPSLDELADLRSALQTALDYDDIDLVALNNTSPVLRFETVCGRAIYTSDIEARATFVSLTAREYEDEMAQWQRALNLKT